MMSPSIYGLTALVEEPFHVRRGAPPLYPFFCGLTHPRPRALSPLPRHIVSMPMTTSSSVLVTGGGGGGGGGDLALER